MYNIGLTIPSATGHNETLILGDLVYKFKRTVGKPYFSDQFNKISLGSNKATGLDGIPSRFVGDGASIIACPLTHVINLCLIQGVVPVALKSARVPLFRKNDKTEVGNYRPVSILTIISKVFERVVYDHVESYLDQKKLLYKFQSGFRSRYSSDTCLTHLNDFINFRWTGVILLVWFC